MTSSRTASIDAISCSPPFTKYFCRRRQGALLTLPYDGLRKDVIRTKVFEEYIRDHVDSWFSMAQKHKLVERMEDLILVTGCTLVTSWGAAAFVDSASDAELSMRFLAHQNGGSSFDWHENRPSVAFNSRNQDLHQNPVRFFYPYLIPPSLALLSLN